MTMENDPDNADDFIDIEEYQLVCPHCGSSDFAYIGEAFDDDQYLGSSYDCNDCGHSFTIDDSLEQ